MILKLRMRGSKRSVAWRLLDKIKKVDYEFVDEKIILAKKVANDPVIYINNYPKVPDKRVTELYFIYEDGTGDMLYTDDMVYIMNDNGKTCDTINV